MARQYGRETLRETAAPNLVYAVEASYTDMIGAWPGTRVPVVLLAPPAPAPERELSPRFARRLAAALIRAADEAEKRMSF